MADKTPTETPARFPRRPTAACGGRGVARTVRSPLQGLCGGLLVLFIVMIACLVGADLMYLSAKHVGMAQVWSMLSRERVIFALRMSVATSLSTLLLVLVTAVPIGYALSRMRFSAVMTLLLVVLTTVPIAYPLARLRYSVPTSLVLALLTAVPIGYGLSRLPAFGRALADAMIDVPIVLPPVVTGISLLAFFSFGLGAPITEALSSLHLSLVSGVGIVMCQYLVAVSYCIRSAKTAFEGVDRNLEQVARVLGCSEWQAFWRVSVPLAGNGLIAGGVMAWARAIGVFGPLMVFVGTGPRVLVMPTTLWLELSIGNIETAIVVALIMLLLAGTALALVHWLTPEGTAI